MIRCQRRQRPSHCGKVVDDTDLSTAKACCDASGGEAPRIIGKANLLAKGHKILVIGIGPIISEALESKKILEPKGINIGVATMGSIRPLDKNFLEKMISEGYHKWITLEEHGIIGGLGSTLIEWVSDNDKFDKVKIHRLGVPEIFINELGNQAYTRKKLGIDKDGISKFIKEL